MNIKYQVFLCLIVIITLFSCKTEKEGVGDSLFGTIPSPMHNPLSREGVELGEKLFFDPMLSSSNDISCASCHKPELSFSDGLALSNKGVSKDTLLRHVPALVNLAWAENGLFWDGGAKNLESLVFGPLTHPDEMNKDLKLLVHELNHDPTYLKGFQSAFRTDSVSTAHIARALAQYMRTLVYRNSKYDKVERGEAVFTDLELEGMAIFEKKCSSCHPPPLFTDHQFHNNGLDSSFENKDFEEIFLGRYRVTKDPRDIGKYKTPSLRNIQKTAPYMHDGRFNTLHQVLGHYVSGIQNSPTTDSLLYEQGIPGLKISEQGKSAIIMFLKTLTDG